MKIYNRRYTGSKYKLIKWIREKIIEECPEANSFFDVFAGTGVVSSALLDLYDEFYINDFLFSNEIIYKGFFEQGKYSAKKLDNIKTAYNLLDSKLLPENYVSVNYGNKYFSQNDAIIIGFIRQDIEDKLANKSINKKEYSILLTSLIYSFDKISNTVGHYEAYIKGKPIEDKFHFELIEPYKLNKKIHIYREDGNTLCRKIKADIAFVDPPYNSRQYSRFYHVLETIVKWDKPELKGVAMKPAEENMSEYCRNQAPYAFRDLVENLNAKYIVVTYNNTYQSKSTSSQNKISLEQIKTILEKAGRVVVFEHKHNAFNAGKTDLKDHKEYLFICTTTKNKQSYRSPLFYVGDKYKLMPQLRELFPSNIENYIEPFVGGGSSFINTTAKHYYVNDIDSWIMQLHEFLLSYVGNEEKLYLELFSIIDKYGLTCSYRGIDVPEGYREKYKKTYFARANKEAYLNLKRDFNLDKQDIKKLYLLLIYGFNHMIRFNKAGEFNLPVGNVDYNKNVHKALSDYLYVCAGKDIRLYSLDYKAFIKSVPTGKNSYVYLDPPYLIAASEYNKMWDETDERELYGMIDELHNNGVSFGLTNLVMHKGKVNTMLIEWAKKYRVFNIKSNYISFNDNTIKEDSQEVFVTNYGK